MHIFSSYFIDWFQFWDHLAEDLMTATKTECSFIPSKETKTAQVSYKTNHTKQSQFLYPFIISAHSSFHIINPSNFFTR